MATERIPDDALGGRLPLIPPDALDDAQRHLYDRLVRSRLPEGERSGFAMQLPDGRFVGPFNAFLHAPRLAEGLNDWVDAQAAHAGLADDVRQAAILAVGVAWNAPYEVYTHLAAARAVGFPEAALDAILQGRDPEGLSPAATLAHRFARALARDHAVPDDLYAETVAALGVPGTVALVHLVGQYLAVSALLIAFRVPAPQV